MIIHCSAKIAQKLPEKPPKQAAVPAIGHLLNWHAHFLTIQRRQCVLFCEDSTRFMLLAKGLTKTHFTHFRDTFELVLAHGLHACCGLDADDIKKVITTCGDMQLDTTTNRSVQGTMRVAAFEIPFFCDRHDLMKVSNELQGWLNDRPVTVKDRKDTFWPDREMTKLIEQILQTGK